MLTRFVLMVLTVSGLSAITGTAAESNSEKTLNLIKVIRSDAPFFDKARACQQLGEFGTPEAVPALAGLLADEHLSAYARSGLEGIPGPSGAEALRNAASALRGDRLAGVINSLGVLRDPKAVPLLQRYADDPASGASREALLALGRIATEEAINNLRAALTDGSEMKRTNAAAACLLAAERRLTDGRADSATTIYDAVRTADLPEAYRAAGLRGAIVARKADGVPLLIEHLRSDSLPMRNAALLAIREAPGDILANALNEEISRASTPLQLLLITALVDCHNLESLPLLQRKADDENPEIRRTALAVLGRIGGAPEVGVLLQAVAHNRTAEESATAIASLTRLAGPAVDEQILKALTASADADLRIALIRLAEARPITNATGPLLQEATDPNVKVCVAALNALKSLAGPNDLPALVSIAKSCRDEGVRAEAGNAIVGLCTRTGEMARGGEAVLSQLATAVQPAEKNAWITMLVSLGYPKALPAILTTLNDPNDSIAANTIEQLARWPDPEPVDRLLALSQNEKTSPRGRRALTSAVRLATNAAEERQRPTETLVDWFRRANETAQTVEEKRAVISGLGRLARLESLRLLVPYLDNPDLRNEAAVAVMQVAPGVSQDDPSMLKEALEKIVEKAQNPDLRTQAQKILSALPGRGRPIQLFDGRSLAGWEGNTNVWRVRDGMIIGGSMQGNPRNEFLSTLSRHTNFVLRLEYKLVGNEGFVNGGVQFRSLRVAEPSNEMSGYQADIGAGFSGCLYDESRRNKFLIQAADELIKRLEKAGEWNRYEIRCAGPRIQILLNGEKTIDYTETDTVIPQQGLIALQIHGSCKAEISFRNLMLEE